MKQRLLWSALWLGLLIALGLEAGIIPAIIPAAAPTANKTGTGARFTTSTAAGVSGNCGQWSAAGDMGDSGSPCGGGAAGPTGATGATGPAGNANASCVFSGLATGCGTPSSIDVSAFGATSPDQFLTQCFTGASTTQTPVTITSYAYTTSVGVLQTIAPAFASAAAAGYCVVNGSGGGGSGGGSVASTTFASLPATCSSGALYLFTNSAIAQALCGASNTYTYYVSGLGQVTPPVLASFTAFNSPTTSGTNGGIILTAPQNGSDNYRGVTQAIAAAPYTTTACYSTPNGNVNFLPIALAVTDGTKYAAIGSYNDTSPAVRSFKLTNVTTFSAYYNTVQYNNLNSMMCVRIQDNSTNRIMSWSVDNVNFVQLTSVSDTDFVTPTRIGLIIDSNNATFASTAWFVHFLTTTP